MGQERTNAARAASVACLVDAFASAQELSDEDVQIRVSDLVTNLLHYCASRQIDPSSVVVSAMGHYASETICETELGPDFVVDVTLNGMTPADAIQSART